MKTNEFIYLSLEEINALIVAAVNNIKMKAKELSREDYKEFNYDQKLAEYQAATTPAKKAALVLKNIFPMLNRPGVSFKPGARIGTKTEDKRSEVETYYGALISVEGSYKESCETLRHFIKKFLDNTRCFEICEVDEVLDELKNKYWQSCTAVLWTMPLQWTVELTLEKVHELMQHLRLSFMYVPEVYVYQESSGEVKLKAICKNPDVVEDWKIAMEFIAGNLQLENAEDPEKLYCEAVIWHYKRNVDLLKRLPDSVVTRRKEFSSDLMCDGAVSCDVCGKLMPVPLEFSGECICSECAGHGHKPMYMRSELEATEESRFSC